MTPGTYPRHDPWDCHIFTDQFVNVGMECQGSTCILCFDLGTAKLFPGLYD